jgi:3-phosphoshikimate 1-carboxyvinyltransferase
MAMAFAPVALTRGTIVINNPEVVSKSYPNFWQDLKKCGFKLD